MAESKLLDGGVDLSDDLEDQEEQTEQAEHEDDTSASEGDAWTPPTEAEWNKTQRALKRAKKQAAEVRTQAKDAPTEDDIDAKVRAAREEEQTKAKVRIVRAEARAKLSAAGASGDLAKLLRMIDVDDVDVDDDGETDGLDDQIEDLKQDFPGLFGKASKAVKADPRTKADASDKPPAKQSMSSADRIARMLQGK